MLSDLDQFYLRQEEPLQSYYIALKEVILQFHREITPDWKYRLPFFYFRGKMLCYICFHKKFKKPYLAFYHANLVDHPDLIAENRARVKILLLVPEEDIPVGKINKILASCIDAQDAYINSKVK